jgi:hypothetical protein
MYKECETSRGLVGLPFYKFYWILIYSWDAVQTLKSNFFRDVFDFFYFRNVKL